MPWTLHTFLVCALTLTQAARIKRSFPHPLGTSPTPSPPVPDYNETEAKLFFQFARVSFCSNSSISQWNCGDMCSATAARQALPFKSARWKVRGYVATLGANDGPSDRKCMVAFRGTVNPNNIVADALFWQKSWPNWKGADKSTCPKCKVHAGVAKGYRALRSKMWSAIEQLGCKRLDFTGHSLGGGLASLASLEARLRQDVHVDRVYTFAKLRIGNQDYVNSYVRAATMRGSSPPMWRVVGYLDPIPHLPMYRVGFAHEPLEVYYYADNFSSYDFSSYKVCPPSIKFTPHYAELENKTCSYQTSWSRALAGPNPSWSHNTYFNVSADVKLLTKQCTGDARNVDVAVDDLGQLQTRLLSHGPTEDDYIDSDSES